MKSCIKCQEAKPLSEFYKNGDKPHSWCKQCNILYTIGRQQQNKRAAIEYKGGACIRCGYSKCHSALEFHHRDPTVKDVSWRKLKLRSFEKIKTELDKCDLVCANCHREIHEEWFQEFGYGLRSDRM